VPMWCVAPQEMNEGNSLGQGYNRPTGCSAEKAPHANFFKYTKHAYILSEDLNTFQHTHQGQLAKFLGMADKNIFRIISAGKYEAQTPLMFKIYFKLSLVIYPVINPITSCNI